MPPPRVDSSVLRLDRIERSEDPAVLSGAAVAANAAFAQRRKTIRNSVLSATGWRASALDAALAASGIDSRVRAETLSVDDYLRLATQLRDQGLLPVVPHNNRHSTG
jgi:16S rRNA (adenine1518-N6/adenine1519-N6)-dimethyltransferase